MISKTNTEYGIKPRRETNNNPAPRTISTLQQSPASNNRQPIRPYSGRRRDVLQAIARLRKHRSPESGGKHPPGIRHPASGIRHPASGIRHPASGLRHPAAGSRHPASGIRHPASGIRHPASGIRHPASGIRHPASAFSSGVAKPLHVNSLDRGPTRILQLHSASETDYAEPAIDRLLRTVPNSRSFPPP